MSDIIDRQAVIEEIARRDTTDGTIKVYSGREVIEILRSLPSAQTEVTEEAVKEYCRKRCLCIVDSALLKKYASAQQKPLKYSGYSICVYCMTGDCAGCVYEPMEGVMNE